MGVRSKTSKPRAMGEMSAKKVIRMGDRTRARTAENQVAVRYPIANWDEFESTPCLILAL